MLYEVFAPREGSPIYVVRYRWCAALLAWLLNLDYAPVGEGWV